MSTDEPFHGDVHHSDLFILNVDALYGRLLVRAPISSIGELDRLRLPDGTYFCDATPRRLEEEDVALVNGRIVLAQDAVYYLRSHDYLSFFHLSLARARKVLRIFEQLNPSAYHERLGSLYKGTSHSIAQAKDLYLMELINYRILVENVSVLMAVSAEETSLQKNPLAGMATRFSTRVLARDYLARVYQRMRVLVKRARTGRIKNEEIDEYVDLRLEAIALELLMEDPEWPQ
ncbi:MAG: hypothetical protein UX20_C0026G0009 [Candidatus Magasanikbacteria bacterium GW2011_GWC2_45_8]|uniref:Uncharacterized protein n=1 Tax=Candidatus Magasanikbacteria bacterium GW2011_GWC2_45_8 TaxID=1619050 RepID=A0A0G1MYH1_9BACT|nr:MAG: hypothetical protein UX20_C0026G0009 [Candidatus Magasanikbacteria bacterium GW2011_GWC2_45_8]